MINLDTKKFYEIDFKEFIRYDNIGFISFPTSEKKILFDDESKMLKYLADLKDSTCVGEIEVFQVSLNLDKKKYEV